MGTPKGENSALSGVSVALTRVSKEEEQMNEPWSVPGKYEISKYNFADEVVADYDFPEKVPISDGTFQKMDRTPGARIYSVEEKLEIAAMLDELGVATVNTNPNDYLTHPMVHPARNKAITDGIRAIAKKGFKLKVSASSRFPVVDGSYKDQIDRVIDLGIDIFIVHPPAKRQWDLFLPDWPWDRMRGQCIEAIEYAKTRGVEVGVSTPDVVRLDFDQIVYILNLWIDNGADSLHLADTLSTLSPQGTRYLFKAIGKELHRKVPLLYHVHNDYGMAVAQVIAAVAAGAWPEASINGFGDRGFVNLDELVLSLEVLYRVNTGIKMEKLTEASQLVERIQGIKNGPQKPVVGEAMHVPSLRTTISGCSRAGPLITTPSSLN